MMVCQGEFFIIFNMGHFGPQGAVEGPFWHICRAVWAEGPFGLDYISWSNITSQKYSIDTHLDLPRCETN